MGGFGAMSGMISSLKNNRNLRNPKKTRKDRKSEHDSKIENGGEPLVFENKMSPIDRQLFLQELKNQRRKRLIFNLFFALAFLLIVAWVLLRIF